MDYALLAATALGAIGLFLMLPRERAPIARLGMILGAMALAALFLSLINKAHTSFGGAVAGGDGGPPIYFYVFSAIMIAGAIGVVCQPRPVYAALYFVLVTLAGAGLFVLLLAEFMAIVLIIIYAGAILVTYVFVIMLASQGSTGGNVVAPAYDRRATGAFVAVVVAFVLVGTALQALLPRRVTVVAAEWKNDASSMDVTKTLQDKVTDGRLDFNANALTFGSPATGSPWRLELTYRLEGLPARTQIFAQDTRVSIDHLLATAAPNLKDQATDLMSQSFQDEAKVSNVQVLGASLYSQYDISLELAGILLTIALIGAVIIARKNTHEHEALGSGKVPAE